MFLINNYKNRGFYQKKGLSFIEVMYSILLFASTVVILAQISSGATTHLERSKRYHIVTELMNNKLTQLEMDFQKEGFSALQETQIQQFKNHPHFSWSLKTKKAELAHQFTPRPSAETKEELGAVGQISTQISTLVTEVQLTIHYTRFNKKSSYSITTYFVDFKKVFDKQFIKNIILTAMPAGNF